MAELSTLDAIVAFHGELISLKEGRSQIAEFFSNEGLIDIFQTELEKLWELPAKSEASRNQLRNGTDYELRCKPNGN